jgi:hypothetical protein
VASLWPGLGENVIQAQERARREEQERRDEEEAARRREIEEAEKKKEEETKATEEAATSVDADADAKMTPALPQQGAGDIPTAAASTGADPSGSGSGATGVSRVNKGKERASEEDMRRLEQEEVEKT